MNVLFTVLVTFFAGMGAGLGTGFAGMSAAAVISPMLITFLHMDPYMAVGIALSRMCWPAPFRPIPTKKQESGHQKRPDHDGQRAGVHGGGQLDGQRMPAATMGGFSVFMTFLLGIKFIVRR